MSYDQGQVSTSLFNNTDSLGNLTLEFFDNAEIHVAGYANVPAKDRSRILQKTMSSVSLTPATPIIGVSNIPLFVNATHRARNVFTFDESEYKNVNDTASMKVSKFNDGIDLRYSNPNHKAPVRPPGVPVIAGQTIGVTQLRESKEYPDQYAYVNTVQPYTPQDFKVEPQMYKQSLDKQVKASVSGELFRDHYNQNYIISENIFDHLHDRFANIDDYAEQLRS